MIDKNNVANKSILREFTHRLCVAPMLDWTDRHCRFLHRLLAPHAYLYTEMITTGALLRGDAERLLTFDVSEHPVALQIGGSEPEALAAAAKLGEQASYDEINLNVGCPSPRVKKGRFGACLFKEPELVAECVQAMMATVKIPVTVKTRLGVDEFDQYSHLTQFIEALVAVGCKTIILHARKAWLQGLSPKENRTVPPLCYDSVFKIKQDFPALEVIINGGITDNETVKTLLNHVDGVMIGRAAYHDPYHLHLLEQQLFGTVLQTRGEILVRYVDYMALQESLGVSRRTLIKPLLGLFHGQTGGRHFRRILSSNEAQKQLLDTLVQQIVASVHSEGI